MTPPERVVLQRIDPLHGLGWPGPPRTTLHVDEGRTNMYLRVVAAGAADAHAMGVAGLLGCNHSGHGEQP